MATLLLKSSAKLGAMTGMRPRSVRPLQVTRLFAAAATHPSAGDRDKAIVSEAEPVQEVTIEEVRGDSASAGVSGTTSEPDKSSSGGLDVKVIAAGTLLLGVAILFGAAFLYKDQIKVFITQFSTVIDEMGPWGIVMYMFLYTGLELVAVPAVPLTMTAGALFGFVPGTIAVSISATAAATLSFLIARYAARDRILSIAKGNAKFAAIDRALEKNSFQVVTLLRLSPLLPFALGNYLYGLTSVRLGPYILGSWLGMLPGTMAYVSAGKYGREILEAGGTGSVHWWQIVVGLGATALALWYVGKMANEAMKDAVKEEAAEAEAEADRKKKGPGPGPNGTAGTPGNGQPSVLH